MKRAGRRVIAAVPAADHIAALKRLRRWSAADDSRRPELTRQGQVSGTTAAVGNGSVSGRTPGARIHFGI